MPGGRKKKKKNLQNYNKTWKNPVPNIRPSNPGQCIRPSNPGQCIRPSNPGQCIRPSNPGQCIRPSNPGQCIRPSNPGECIRPSNPGQCIRPSNPGQCIRPSNPGQCIRPSNPGQCIRPVAAGPQIRPAYAGQTIRQGNPNQHVRPKNSCNDPGQPIFPEETNQKNLTGKSSGETRPGNITKFVPPRYVTERIRPSNSSQYICPNAPVKPELIPLPDKKDDPGYSGDTNQPIGHPGQGPKFKPLQEVEIPHKVYIMKPNTQKITELEITENPIMTIVGKTRENNVKQQKKILKFQMRMQSMQQEKQRTTKNVESTNISKSNDVANVFSNPNVDMPNPVDLPNSIDVPKPTEIPIPLGMPTPSGMPSCTKKETSTHIIGGPNTSTVRATATSFFMDISNEAELPKAHSIPISSGLEVPNHHPNQNIKPQVPATPIQQYEAVETAFQIDDSQRSFTPPLNTVQPTQPHNNTRMDLAWMQADVYSRYSLGYTKGIPRSFVVQQLQQNRTSSSNPSDGPIWPIYPPNAPQMVPSPANDPNSRSPLSIQTDSQSAIQQPYSPSELYSDFDQTGSQGPAIFRTGEEDAITRNQAIAILGRKFAAAYKKARLKFISWVAHSKPKSGPFYEDMLLTRRIYKSIKKRFNTEQNIKAGVAYGNLYLEDLEPSDGDQAGNKRLSVFRRLGPQTQAKKPKLTINLTVNDDQEVREVVDESEDLEMVTPVHLRQDIILSTDETVMKHLKSWPWKKNVYVKRSVTARNSKTVMILEREQMEEIYERDTVFMQVTVKDYPPNWTKEQVLDLLMENIRGYSFIPCFIEFNQEECKFLTLRCRSALLSLHKCGFIIRKDDIQLVITISQTELTLNQIDFVPRLVLRKRLTMSSESETKLNLSEFTLKEDISHFIYFPLNRLNNQSELVQMQSEINWFNLTDLNLSHNRITSLDGFDFEQITPKLKHLDLSYNCIEKLTILLKCRQLPLKSIHLEGNPLCTDYTDPDQYVKVVKMMFSGVTMIDDLPVKFKGDIPKFIRNYCPTEAKELVDKFLEIYFPLLDGDVEHRAMLQEMYEDNANMTITYHYKLAFGPIYRCFKTLFQNARQMEQDNMTIVKGSSSIIKTILSWPYTEHDPFTFTVDVLYHNDATTIIRIDGILKLTRESLAEDEHLLAFSRTLVLHTRDYVEYKIQTEMLYWSLPHGAYAKMAFAVTAIKTKQMHPKIDSTTDEKLQGELLKIFMKLTSMNKTDSERCLEIKKWNLKEALDHFTKLVKLDSLDLTKEVS